MKPFYLFLYLSLITATVWADTPSSDPVILLDQGHNNWAWKPEIYAPVMEKFLRESGYDIRFNTGAFTKESLIGVDILEIDNVFPPGDNNNWSKVRKSAFTEDEISILYNWVNEGGSLLLVVEHMPFPGAFEDLAEAFGIQVSDGFALEENAVKDFNEGTIAEAGYLVFRREDGSLSDHKVLFDHANGEFFPFLTTDVGSAFRLPEGATSLITLGEDFISLEPENSWQFDSFTPFKKISGWSQAGLLRVGRGKVAILGDSFLFTAPGYLEPPYIENERDKFLGANNHIFTMNLLRWLNEE